MIGNKSEDTCGEPSIGWKRQWDWVVREVATNNLIRRALFLSPIKIRFGPVARTPRQQRRHFKKKRIHREWKIKRLWRRRNGMSWWRAWTAKIRMEVSGHRDEVFASLVSIATVLAETKMKKTGR